MPLGFSDGRKFPQMKSENKKSKPPMPSCINFRRKLPVIGQDAPGLLCESVDRFRINVSPYAVEDLTKSKL